MAGNQSYLIGSQPNYGEIIAQARNGEVVFTDDFNKFLDDLLRTLAANFDVIQQILIALGADPTDVGEIITKGLTTDLTKSFYIERTDGVPDVPEGADDRDIIVAALRSDGRIKLYRNPDA